MYWDRLFDDVVDFTEHRYYSQFENLKATNPQNFRCDPLGPSPILFLGSCDMGGPVNNPDDIWPRRVYRKLLESQGGFPYIALSKISSGLEATLRRLYIYCELVGPPKVLYMVMPRPVSLEVPVKRAMTDPLVGVTDIERYLTFLGKLPAISTEEVFLFKKISEVLIGLSENESYQLYQFEKGCAFLQTLCRLHKIELYWTPNLSATAIEYYAKYFPMFLKENAFMRQTCLGVGKALDFSGDGSVGDETQAVIANMMLVSRPGEFSMEDAQRQLVENLEFKRATKEEQ